MPNTTDWPSRPASTEPLRSLLPVSTATTRCTGLLWSSSEPMTRGSHAAPSCATITAVTTCCGYVSFDDKWGPLALQRATCRPGRAVRPFMQGSSNPVNNTRRGSIKTARCRAWLRSGRARTLRWGGRSLPRHGRRPGLPGLDRLALEPPALALRQPAPDAEPLIVLEGVLEALGPNLTAPADLLRLPGGAALFREERLRIGLRAQRAILPVQLFGIVNVDVESVVHQRDDDLSHYAPPAP